MGKKRKKTDFDVSLIKNQSVWQHYVDRLTELSISMFEWRNVPDTIDTRYLELVLFGRGSILFFEDEILGHLCLPYTSQGRLDVYKNPMFRRAQAANSYHKECSAADSVIIYNNLLREPSRFIVNEYAYKLWNLDRIIDVNTNAQKTPVLLQGPQEQRLTLLNLYKEFDGNAPVIHGGKNLDISGFKVLKTDAPFVSDKIYELKAKIWNEALTYLGITNISYQKRERLISDEVTRSQGGTIASRWSRLHARQMACEKINKMFGLDISVVFRGDDPDESTDTADPMDPFKAGDPNE